MYGPDVIISVLQSDFLIFTNRLRDRYYYYPSVSKEGSKSQRLKAICQTPRASSSRDNGTPNVCWKAIH